MKLYQLMLNNTPVSDWDNIFFLEATLWSRRSHDRQTQCGCVLVKNKTNISSGYNGFIRDIDDHSLPSVRPEKYPFMIHAEANAIYNATRNGQSTLNATAYITAIPCLHCLQMLYQCGVKEIVFSDISSPKMNIWNGDYDQILELIGDKIQLRFIPKTSLDTEFLLESVEKITKM
tara:strand:+ start:106 stop:630 length:525 start_codon:yes stop_codon:yes gene_type:complete